MAKERKPKPPMVLLSDRRRIHLHLSYELVDWIDREAKRQRRSRAYVIGQACDVFRAILKELEPETTHG